MLIFTKTKTDTTETVEGDNLAAHVVMCRQRELAMDKRMEEIEERQDVIAAKEQELRSYILKTITTAALALLSSSITVGVLISQLFKN